jgi:uncharacterized membrane protein
VIYGLIAAIGWGTSAIAATNAVSSVCPAIPLLAGLVMFGERLGRWQLLGVTLIITGLVLIGLG